MVLSSVLLLLRSSWLSVGTALSRSALALLLFRAKGAKRPRLQQKLGVWCTRPQQEALKDDCMDLEGSCPHYQHLTASEKGHGLGATGV